MMLSISEALRRLSERSLRLDEAVDIVTGHMNCVYQAGYQAGQSNSLAQVAELVERLGGDVRELRKHINSSSQDSLAHEKGGSK